MSVLDSHDGLVIEGGCKLVCSLDSDKENSSYITILSICIRPTLHICDLIR